MGIASSAVQLSAETARTAVKITAVGNGLRKPLVDIVSNVSGVEAERNLQGRRERADLKGVPSPRRITYDYQSLTSPMWTPRRPEFSCAANSVSLMMPIIEPYFVRSARRALPLLSSSLVPLATGYLEQEAEHLRQHRLFNQLLVDNYPSLRHTERFMKRAYRWLEDHRSLEFSCAFAAVSETMAYSAARWAAERRTELFGRADEVAATLFLWHLAEEVEHKSAAFEIHRQLVAAEGRPVLARCRLLGAMALALGLVVLFVVWGTTVMLWGEHRFHHPIAWYRLTRWSLVFAFELLSNLTLSLLPGFHPDDLADPLFYEVWLREFDADTGSIPPWTDVPIRVGSPTQPLQETGLHAD